MDSVCLVPTIPSLDSKFDLYSVYISFEIPENRYIPSFQKGENILFCLFGLSRINYTTESIDSGTPYFDRMGSGVATMRLLRNSSYNLPD